ncbi:MAG: signal peptidase I [Candidatus Levybacteria bacterium]|nr:signal peptidase I [Candidatus Levybacteria bacterium]
MGILRKIYSFLLDAVQTFLLAAAFFLVIYVFLFRPFQVNGDSMFPNFKDQEYVLTNIIQLRFQEPKLGDVIVFKAPPDPEKDYIKRVIGVPGDRVMVRDGNVYVNGKMLDESSYLKPTVRTYAGSFLKEGEEVTVPQGSFLAFGDNRPYSSDSREWGWVPKDLIIGHSFFAYWPPPLAGLIKNPYSN